MPDRDAALAHAIYERSVRRWITLRYVATRFLRQRWDTLHPEVVAALLGGASQILFFDRVPVHAAIDESVEWLKAGERPNASGLINAVLRRIAGLVERDAEGSALKRASWRNRSDELPLSDGTALVLKSPQLPEGETPRAASACGIPGWQMRAWAAHLGEDDAVHTAHHSLADAPTILNTLHSARPLPATHVERHDDPAAAIFVGTRAELVRMLGERSDVWVQDSTSASAIRDLEGSVFERIIDLCAGRGTKTRQLLHTFPAARVVACDVAEWRLDDLRILAAASDDRCEVEHAEAARSARVGWADLVVADVPCSNSGVLARRAEARHRCSKSQLARLNEQQREIASAAVSMISPGGTLLYSTCSLEPEENQQIVEWLVTEHGMTLHASRHTLPDGGPGTPPASYRDGGFAAVLRRSVAAAPD